MRGVSSAGLQAGNPSCSMMAIASIRLIVSLPVAVDALEGLRYNAGKPVNLRV
jgi:hypothetical protein